MKVKYLIILLFVLTSYVQINAQQKRDWGQVYVSSEQNLLFTSKEFPLYSKTKYTPYITIGAEVRLIKELTAYIEYGFAISTDQNRLRNNINYFGELDANKKLDADLHLLPSWDEQQSKANLGLSYRFYCKGWRLSPQIGFGAKNFPYEDTYIQLKELGTSNIYEVLYKMRRDNTYGDETLNYMQFRFRIEKKLFRRFSLNITTGYNLYLNKLEFYGEYSDYYTNEIIECVTIAKRPHELTFSLGIGFR